MDLTKNDAQTISATIALAGRAFVDGALRDASDGATFETTNPATGATLGHVAHCTAEDVDTAVTAGKSGFSSTTCHATVAVSRFGA